MSFWDSTNSFADSVKLYNAVMNVSTFFNWEVNCNIEPSLALKVWWAAGFLMIYDTVHDSVSSNQGEYFIVFVICSFQY